MKNFLYILMLGIFALAGCSGSNTSDEEKALTNNTETEVIIRLGLNKQTTPSGRILGTYQDIVSITLSWENTSDPADSNSTELEQVDGIWTGSIGGSITVDETYTFRAEAFNATSDLLFSGSTTQSVANGGNNLNIVMVPEDDGTGSSIPVITNLAVPAGFLPGETLQIDFTIKGDSADSLSLGVYGFRGSAISQDSQFATQEIDLSLLTPTLDGAYYIYSDNVSISIPAELSEDVISFIFAVRTGDGRSSNLNFTVQRGAIGQEKFLNFLPVPTYFNLNQGAGGNYNADLELDGYDTSSGLSWSAEIQNSASEYLMGASVSPNSGYLNINFTPTSDYTDVFLVITVQDPMDPYVTANYTYNIPQLTTGSVIETIGTLENNNYLTHNGTKKYLSAYPSITGTGSTTLNMRVIDPDYEFEFHNSGWNSIDVSIASEAISYNLQPGESTFFNLSVGSHQVQVSSMGPFQLEISEQVITIMTDPQTGEKVRLSEGFTRFAGTLSDNFDVAYPENCEIFYPFKMPNTGGLEFISTATVAIVNSGVQFEIRQPYDEYTYNPPVGSFNLSDSTYQLNSYHNTDLILRVSGSCESQYDFSVRLFWDNDPGLNSTLRNDAWAAPSTSVTVRGRAGFQIGAYEIQYWDFNVPQNYGGRIDIFGAGDPMDTGDFYFELYDHTGPKYSDGDLAAYEPRADATGLMTIATEVRNGRFTLRVENTSASPRMWFIQEHSGVNDPFIKSEANSVNFNTYFISEENSGFPPFMPNNEVTFYPDTDGNLYLTGTSYIKFQGPTYLDFRNSQNEFGDRVVITIGYENDNVTMDTTGIYDLTRFNDGMEHPFTYQAPAAGVYPLEIYRATQCQLNSCP